MCRAKHTIGNFCFVPSPSLLPLVARLVAHDLYPLEVSVYLSRNSNGYYYIWYRDESGKKQKVSTRKRMKAEAIKALIEYRKLIDQKMGRTNYAQFVEEFLPFAQATYSAATYDLYQRTLKLFGKSIGTIRLREISPRHIDAYLVKRLETIKPTSANIELRALKAAFNTAKRWRLVADNPCSDVRAPAIAEVAPVFFSPDDFERLLRAITEEWFKELVIFAVLTGMRRGEIVNLRWQDVDLSRRLVTIQSNSTFKTKHGKRRVVPLNDRAHFLLSSRHTQVPTDPVFVSPGGILRGDSIGKKLKKCVHQAKLPDQRLHFHSLRHTFASWLVRVGTSLYEVQRLLGHSNSRTTEVYAHLQTEEMHRAVNRIKLELS
jgi:integrase